MTARAAGTPTRLVRSSPLFDGPLVEPCPTQIDDVAWHA